MKNLYLVLFVLVAFPLCGFSQGENDNWYFGHNAGVNFSTNPPTVLTDSQMDQFEGVASISDSNGQLLFYTNGNSVWSRDHQIMLNGTGLAGNESSQQVIILPYPSHPDLYYIFTMAKTGSNSSFIAYSIVNMDLGNIGSDGFPLGGVEQIYKNTPVLNEYSQPFSYKTEAVTAVLKGDGSGYWVLIPNGTKLYSYNLDSQGFDNGNPNLSSLTFSLPFQNYGSIKSSSEIIGSGFTNLISISGWNGSNSNETRIYSFDNNLGLLTTDYELQIFALVPYSMEFSSNGSLLYAVRYATAHIFVLDLFNPNPQNIIREIVDNQNLHGGTIQRAINGKIYISLGSSTSGSPYLAEVVNPNSFLNSTINFDSIYLNGEECGMGLPQLIPIFDSITFCQGESIVLSTPELNTNFTYRYSNSIITNQNYMVSNTQDITLKAGNYIELRPNSHIKHGSLFLAEIESCVAIIKPIIDKNAKPFKISINLADYQTPLKLNVYPNPANQQVTISVNQGQLKNVSVITLKGETMISKKAINSTSCSLDVRSLINGVYIVKAETSDGEIISNQLIKE